MNVPRSLALLGAAVATLLSSPVQSAEGDGALPKPKVSISVSSALIGSAFGMTDAALEGIVAALREHSTDSEAVPLTADQLTAVKSVVGLTKDAVSGVRVRVYADVDAAGFGALSAEHDARVGSEPGWEPLLDAEDGEKRVRIALRSEANAVRGARVLAVDGKETVVVEADCDVSPERAREIAHSVTKVALDLGLEAELEKAVREMREKVNHKPR